MTRLEATGAAPAAFTADLAIVPVATTPVEERAGASDSDWEKIGAIAAAVALMAFAIFARPHPARQGCYFNSRDRRRSLSTRPPVWQVGQ